MRETRVSSPGSGRSPGERNGTPLQYVCLGNAMDRGTWRATVHGVARVGHDTATKPPPCIFNYWKHKEHDRDLHSQRRGLSTFNLRVGTTSVRHRHVRGRHGFPTELHHPQRPQRSNGRGEDRIRCIKTRALRPAEGSLKLCLDGLQNSPGPPRSVRGCPWRSGEGRPHSVLTLLPVCSPALSINWRVSFQTTPSGIMHIKTMWRRS